MKCYAFYTEAAVKSMYIDVSAEEVKLTIVIIKIGYWPYGAYIFFGL